MVCFNFKWRLEQGIQQHIIVATTILWWLTRMLTMASVNLSLLKYATGTATGIATGTEPTVVLSWTASVLLLVHNQLWCYLWFLEMSSVTFYLFIVCTFICFPTLPLYMCFCMYIFLLDTVWEGSSLGENTWVEDWFMYVEPFKLLWENGHRLTVAVGHF